MSHEGYNNQVSANSNSVASKFKYNGKELNEELGLDMYDYGARFYDPAVGRWFTPDALAELYYSDTTYGYALENPILYIDPDGNAVEMCCDTLLGTLVAIGDNVLGTNLRSNFEQTPEFVNGTKTGDAASYVGGSYLVAKGFIDIGTGTGIMGSSVLVTEATGGLSVEVTGPTAAAGAGLTGVGFLEAGFGYFMAMNAAGREYNTNDESSSGSSESSVSKEIHEGKQGKHVEGHNNYEKGKSTITSDAQSLLDDFHKGDVKGSTNIDNVKTRVDFGKEIGNFIDKDGNSSPTTNGIIHNSKTGAHIVPARPNL